MGKHFRHTLCFFIVFIIYNYFHSITKFHQIKKNCASIFTNTLYILSSFLLFIIIILTLLFSTVTLLAVVVLAEANVVVLFLILASSLIFFSASGVCDFEASGRAAVVNLGLAVLLVVVGNVDFGAGLAAAVRGERVNFGAPTVDVV